MYYSMNRGAITFEELGKFLEEEGDTDKPLFVHYVGENARSEIMQKEYELFLEMKFKGVPNSMLKESFKTNVYSFNHWWAVEKTDETSAIASRSVI